MNESENLREISFIIPTYNASFHIERCLDSIRNQRYPQEKIEVLVIEGGSFDNTLDLVKKYNCKILNNAKRLAEFGIQLGIKEARGELVVIFAADNELAGDDWIHRVVNIFDIFPEVSAVWGELASGKNDPPLNKYFELIQSDPLNWFLNNNLSRYKKKAARYGDDCFIFEVDPKRPLVWGANGLVYRRRKIEKIWAQEGYLGDNDAFQYMIEQGNSVVAYFDYPFVYHHHVATLKDWVNKWRRNFVFHLSDKQRTRNMNWVFTDDFKIKLFFWTLYSSLPIISFLHSSYLVLRDRNIYWFYHPVVNFLQLFTYVSLVVFTQKGHLFIRQGFFKLNRR